MPEEDYLRRSPVRFDQPEYQTCYEYWQRLRGARRSPRWSEWDWFQLPVDLIPYFIVVDVTTPPLDFVYRFYGTASVTMHGKDFTGLSVSKIRSAQESCATHAQYAEVVTHHEAIGSKYTVQVGISGIPIVQTSLRMPFSDDGETVSQIATYVDWSREIDSVREANFRASGEVF